MRINHEFEKPSRYIKVGEELGFHIAMHGFGSFTLGTQSLTWLPQARLDRIPDSAHASLACQFLPRTDSILTCLNIRRLGRRLQSQVRPRDMPNSEPFVHIVRILSPLLSGSVSCPSKKYVLQRNEVEKSPI